MNTPTTSQPTPNLESLHKAVQEFRPNSHRVPFSNLKPFHDSIATLRDKRASYSVIAELGKWSGDRETARMQTERNAAAGPQTEARCCCGQNYCRS